MLDRYWATRHPHLVPAAVGIPLGGIVLVLVFGSQFTSWILTSIAAGAALSLAARILSGQRQDQSLAVREAVFNAVFNESIDALFLVDSSTGEIMDCNEQAAELFKTGTPANMIGTTFSALHPVTVLDTEFLTTIRRHGVWRQESECETQRGWKFWGEVIVQDVKHASPPTLLVRVSDLTQRKQDAEALRHAKEAAEAADQIKSAFLAAISQEIQTLKQGVLSLTGPILDVPLSPLQRGDAEAVSRSANVLQTLVNDILDLSLLEAGTLSLGNLDFDLRTTLEETIAGFTPQARKRGLELTSLVSHEVLPLLRGDPSRLRQILTNLLHMTLAGTDHGEVVVRAALDHQTLTHATLRFSLTITGEGGSQDHFAQLCLLTLQHSLPPPDTNTETALRFALSKKLAAMMGGEIGSNNEPGLGNVLWFTVTFEKRPSKAFATPPPRTNLNGLRALVAGDRHATHPSLHRQCTAWGIVCHSAPDTPLALQMLHAAVKAEEPYDVVLFDWQKINPEVLALVQAIRADATLATLRLVLLVAGGQRGDARKAQQAGLDAYLANPVRQDQLFACLSTVMGQPPKTRSPEIPLITRYTLAESKNRNRPRILVVAPQPHSQRFLTRRIEELGYRANTAANGPEAIQALAYVPYAAVLLDCQDAASKPKRESFEAAAQIRVHDEQHGTYTPLIGLIDSTPTDHTEPDLQGEQREMDAILSLPLDPHALKTVLSSILMKIVA